MKLPAGMDCGTITNPQEEGTIQQLMAFYGAIEIESLAGRGFVLADRGRLVAAYFRDQDGSYLGKEAVDRLGSTHPDEAGYHQTFALHSYTPAEFGRAIQLCTEEGLVLSEQKEASVARFPNLLDEVRLKKMLALPGIIAISVFYEGFSIQSLGDADFEHVAALAEDLLRAGVKITTEMEIGKLDQLILETATNKIIIAPCGDLYLCAFAREDAQLGLLRIAIKNLQNDLKKNA